MNEGNGTQKEGAGPMSEVSGDTESLLELCSSVTDVAALLDADALAALTRRLPATAPPQLQERLQKQLLALLLSEENRRRCEAGQYALPPRADAQAALEAAAVRGAGAAALRVLLTAAAPPEEPAPRTKRKRPGPGSLAAALASDGFLESQWELGPALLQAPGAAGALQEAAAALGEREAVVGLLGRSFSCPSVDAEAPSVAAALLEAAALDGLGGPLRHGADVRFVRAPAPGGGEESFFLGPGCEAGAGDAQLALRAGFSVALRAVCSRSSEAAAAAAQLSQLLGMPVAANLYLTPRGSQGLLAHYDNHCVFAVQLAGAKLWTVASAPTRALPRVLDARVAPAAPLDAAATFLLTAGSALYIPRGFAHSARAEAGQDSAHLTLAVEVPPAFEWAAVLHVALRRAGRALASGRPADSDAQAAEGLMHCAAQTLPDGRAALLASALEAEEPPARALALLASLASEPCDGAAALPMGPSFGWADWILHGLGFGVERHARRARGMAQSEPGRAALQRELGALRASLGRPDWGREHWAGIGRELRMIRADRLRLSAQASRCMRAAHAAGARATARGSSSTAS